MPILAASCPSHAGLVLCNVLCADMCTRCQRCHQAMVGDEVWHVMLTVVKGRLFVFRCWSFFLSVPNLSFIQSPTPKHKHTALSTWVCTSHQCYTDMVSCIETSRQSKVEDHTARPKRSTSTRTQDEQSANNSVCYKRDRSSKSRTTSGQNPNKNEHTLQDKEGTNNRRRFQFECVRVVSCILVAQHGFTAHGDMKW
jgi:hypothetical protein